MKIQRKNLLLIALFTLGIFDVSTIVAEEIGRSSAELVTISYQKGEIDRRTYIIEKLKAYFAPTRVDNYFKSTLNDKPKPTREITMLLTEARLNLDSFTPEEVEFLMVLLKRPDDTTYKWPWNAKPAFYLPAPVLTFEPAVADYPNIGGKLKFQIGRAHV